jgi:hypothetical protein
MPQVGKGTFCRVVAAFTAPLKQLAEKVVLSVVSILRSRFIADLRQLQRLCFITAGAI